MAITPLPPAPLPSDTPAQFNEKAFDLVAALEDFVTEANAQAVAVNADAVSADADAATATTQAGIATTQAGIATTKAGEAATSATEAAELTENYQGALASDPLVNKDGDPLVAGDWYVNTGTGLIRAYTGSAWVTSVNVTAGVSNFSGGTTGLTPSTLTQGDVTLGGTLAVANGGTGLTSPGASGNILVSDGTGFVSQAQESGFPIGATAWVVRQSGSTFSDGDWLLCDGSIYNQSSYPDLYAAIGDIPNSFVNAPFVTTGTSSAIRSCVYGNNLFVAGGDGGNLRTSTDGITWTARTSGTTSTINSLVYGNGLYVYATTVGGISTSTDAITWTARTSGTSSDLYRLLYANNLYVAAGVGGNLRTSTDGITWTARTSSTTRDIRGLAYGNNTYVYCGNSGIYATSTDAIAWTTGTTAEGYTNYAVAYGNNKFVMVGAISAGGGISMYGSTNGSTWTYQAISTNAGAYDLSYGNGIFVLVGGATTGLTYITPDGFKYKSFGIASNTQPAYSVAYGNKTWLIGKGAGAANLYTPYTYSTSTQFALPQSNSAVETFTNQSSYVYSLYIKAQ